MEWRQIAIIVILTLCILDLAFTYYYILKYKKWQPDKPYKLMEKNPLLVFCWNKMGLHFGMLVGGIVIIGLNYLVARYAHWSIVLILFLFMMFAMYNHAHNIQLLGKLITKYPSGHLPESIFGVVEGNNKIQGGN